MKTYNLPSVRLVFLLMIGLNATGNATATPAQGFVTPEICNGWFRSWSEQAKASLGNELKVAKNLGIEKRDLAQALRPVESVAATAALYCERLQGHKIKPAGPAASDTAVKVCVDAFSKWEDERDGEYSMALFEKKLSEKAHEVVIAQDIARREALVAKSLCQALGTLH